MLNSQDRDRDKDRDGSNINRISKDRVVKGIIITAILTIIVTTITTKPDSTVMISRINGQIINPVDRLIEALRGKDGTEVTMTSLI